MSMEQQIMEALARGYCVEPNTSKILDSDLIVAMTQEVLKSVGFIPKNDSHLVEKQVSFAEPNLLEAGWIDTKKELPNNDRFVIIYWDNGYYNEMNVASYDALDMQWYDHNRESFTDNVTHWREFPPKP